MVRILLAFDRFGEVEIAAQAIGNGQVGLKNAPEDLLIELLLEILGGLQNEVGVGVLGLEISQDFRCALVPEPVVVVDAAVAVNDVLDRFTPCPGRGGGRRRGVLL